MYNSAIIRKKCSCGDPECNRWPTFGCAGKNYNCLPEEKKREIGTRRKLIQKKKAYDSAQSRMLHIAQNKADGKTWQLDLFYHGAAVELAKHPYCQECGSYIPKEYYRDATAHILPKRKEYGFPSVAHHPRNRLFLGGGCGCHDKTHTWSTFSKMKVWPLAVEAFKEIYPYIDNKELKNIPNILLETLKENKYKN